MKTNITTIHVAEQELQMVMWPPIKMTPLSASSSKMASLKLPSSGHKLSYPLSSTIRRSELTPHYQPWQGQGLAQGVPTRPKRHVIQASLQHQLLSSSALLEHHDQVFSLAESVGYSLASYYTSLGLFVLSVPGLWSLIKRSVKSKIVQKTFVSEDEKCKVPKQVAGEILSFFTRNNFVVADRGETITFEGMMVPNRGQAALLTFCTCISLGSVALVLTITYPDFGNNWFWITILSPLAGAYYWKRASRKEQIKVKMTVGDDGNLSEIIVQGDDQQVDLMRKELNLREKGMLYVKGIFER